MSPTILKYKEYRFFFFSRQETRIHIHISSQNGEAKYWIEPEIELAKNFGFNEKQLNEIKRFITEQENEIIDAWSKHFKS